MPKAFLCIIECEFNQVNVLTLQVRNPLHLKHLKREKKNLKLECIATSLKVVIFKSCMF